MQRLYARCFTMKAERRLASVLNISRVAKRRITIVAYTISSTTNNIECVQKLRGVYFIFQLLIYTILSGDTTPSQKCSTKRDSKMAAE
jgi:hypothetical protein